MRRVPYSLRPAAGIVLGLVLGVLCWILLVALAQATYAYAHALVGGY